MSSVNSTAVDRFMSIGKALNRVKADPIKTDDLQTYGSNPIKPDDFHKYGYGSKPIKPDDFHKFGVSIKPDGFHKMGSTREIDLSVSSTDVAYQS
jgi:hypothetical protein